MAVKVGREDQPEQWGWMCDGCHTSKQYLTEQEAWQQARDHRRESRCFDE